MATLRSIREALRDTLQQATGLRVYDWIPDTPQLPCVIVEPVSGGFTAFGRGVEEWVLNLRVFAGGASPGHQAELDDWLSGDTDTSIRRALFESPTAGTDPDENVAGTPRVTIAALSVDEYGFASIGEPEVRTWAARLQVRAQTRGDA